jgi:FkbM family methyltransferase
MLKGQCYPNPIFLRKDTSDISTFRKIIFEKEYELPFDVSPDWILDAGANIGLSAIYFAVKYPSAKVIALEPEPGNFEMLKRNVSAYNNIFPINAALWPTTTRLHIISYGKMDNFQVASNEALERDEFLKHKMKLLKGAILFSCDTLTVEDLLIRFNIERIGIFKIDIEGSEKELFENAGAWIDRADLLVVELHERWKPGSTRSFYMNTPGFSREWTKGESVFLSRI